MKKPFQDFINWAFSQDDDRKIDMLQPSYNQEIAETNHQETCILCEYAKDLGFTKASASWNYMLVNNREVFDFNRNINTIIWKLMHNKCMSFKEAKATLSDLGFSSA